jgi:hypothetical protein
MYEMSRFFITILNGGNFKGFNRNRKKLFSDDLNCFLHLSLLVLLFIFSKDSSAQLTYEELKVEFDSAWTFKNLQLIPVRFKAGAGTPLPGTTINRQPISISEALQKHKVKLQEMQYEKGADVNLLQLTNNSKEDVIVHSGEILAGGKQDRMVGETKIFSAGSTDYLNVFCVEKRRWSDKPKKFKHAGVANSDLQKTMNVKGRQSDVWKEIDRQFEKSTKKSETFSYVELYSNTAQEDSDYIRYFTRRYSETDSSFAGFVFNTGNKIMNVELFATTELTNLSFRNMLSSNVQTVRLNGSPPVVTFSKLKTFLDKVLMDEAQQKIYVSSHGKLQITNGKVIHLIAYDD